jgi:hypothetical protein
MKLQPDILRFIGWPINQPVSDLDSIWLYFGLRPRGVSFSLQTLLLLRYKLHWEWRTELKHLVWDLIFGLPQLTMNCWFRRLCSRIASAYLVYSQLFVYDTWLCSGYIGHSKSLSRNRVNWSLSEHWICFLYGVVLVSFFVQHASGGYIRIIRLGFLL